MTPRHLAIALFVAVAFGMAFVLEGYTLYRFTLAGAFAIAILGINLLTGLSGQFSIGHSAFFAVGAYAMALTMQDAGLGPYVGLLAAGMAAFVAGFLFGWPALRLSLVHLALATWALAVAVPQILKSRHLGPLTGGVQGIYLDRPAPPFGLTLSDDQWWHLVTLVVLLLLLWLAGNLMQGRVGRALKAIRDNDIAAASMGINVPIYKTVIFGVSAAYAGVAGGVVALLTDYIAPDSYTLFFAIMLLVGAVAGGLNSVWGAVFGGLLVQFLPDLSASTSAALSLPVQGVILILIVYLLPAGFAGAVMRWLPLLGPRRRLPPPGPAQSPRRRQAR